jgi:hypothetical protein
MAHIRLINLPALKDWVESLLRTPLSIGPLSHKLRSWFGVPWDSGSAGANRHRNGKSMWRTARLCVEPLEERDVSTGTAAINNSKVTTASFSPTLLTHGHKYTWWVGAMSTTNLFGVWSSSQDFTIA